jgi:hypothetical protein
MMHVQNSLLLRMFVHNFLAHIFLTQQSFLSQRLRSS